ncbi:rab11 family-interacting protein 1 isoform X2 [Sphaeramia orbicularis]|uniref:rab11 family-interacting protein 1 isoform X2 n=1 Tax=Sphaeramia orbicularis TaxID=375764 RepID=UPI00117E74AB|nr:rab11 family-interacting protein 1-like isoform X2 [Sphaeramia orbicularis]
MSLADQSQQWFPTSVQVTVHQARNLRVKGKNGTNDAYAIIQVAKDKFSTSVAEKCIDPVWKEEATFDLPLFHPGNAERCTLYIIVMHRAQVGLDKFLGQAVINLVDVNDNKSRKKTDWFKLVDKTGKEDKDRGEVLLNIQFMRNNMSASMFDLSMQDKPRSRISKLKDKVRGKKKDGFSDSASAIVPSVSQVLTDSEGEADSVSLNQSTGDKKKSKLKTLFAPKSNLQRNISQSMSTLGTLPEKNSSLSGSRSSGLNVESPEVKKKFKFLGHKRTGSSDSKVSQGPFSLLGRSKQSASDQNNLCINGSHVYTEEAETKSGSTLSLNSSGQGSVEDVRKQSSDASVDTFKSVPVSAFIRESTDRATLEQQHHQEEEERRQAEERRIAEAKRLEEEGRRRAEAKRLQEEEEKRKAEAKRLQEEEEKHKVEAKRLQEEEARKYREEQERRKRFLEDEARRKKQREEEEERKRQEEERRILEAAEEDRLEEERRQEEVQKAEEQKRQEEASMSDRLSSLFGMIRKKDEKKDEVQPQMKEELPTPAPHHPTDLDPKVTQKSTNPFEDSPPSSDPPPRSNESPADHQQPSRPPITSAMVFLNRTAKVSAVKPRLSQTLESESTDSQTLSQPCPSPAASESTLSSIPSESPENFHSLHSSLAPQNIRQSPADSFHSSTENPPSVGSSPTMADKKRRAPLPPSYPVNGVQSGGREIKNPAYVEADALQQGSKISIPLPDYETLFPQKRHGVQGQTRWDHIIAEVNQKHRDSPPQHLGKEMNVDGPEEEEPTLTSSLPQETSAMRHSQTPQEPKLVTSKKAAAPAPPKPVASPNLRSVADATHRQSQKTALTPPSHMSPNPPAVQGSDRTGQGFSAVPRDGTRKVLRPSPAAVQVLTPKNQMDVETSPPDDQTDTQTKTEAPTARPRQRVNSKEPVQQNDSSVTPAVSERNMNKIPTFTSSSVKNRDKQGADSFAEFDPFPSTELLSNDPWTQPKQNQDVENLFTGRTQKEQKPEDLGMTPDDLDNIFSSEKSDPFLVVNGNDSFKDSHYRKKDEDWKQVSPAFQTQNQSLPARDGQIKSVAAQHEADRKPQSSFYGGEDPFGADPFTVPSSSFMSPSFTSSEPLQVIMEEPASQAGGFPGGRNLLRAEVQPVSAQNSNSGGLALTSRRPHPVKPMSSIESQHPIIVPALKEIKVRDNTPGKMKVSESMESGPYTQLTQEELITLVVKQQADLSRKDAKIVELEEYIDNLLVRVIEENPSILQALNAAKPV